MLLQKQAQQAHIAQLQRAQETQAAATANANAVAAANANANATIAPAAAVTATPTPAATTLTPAAAAVPVNPAAATLGSVAQRSLAVGAALQSRKEEELSRKDRTLAEFLPMMEAYNPIVRVS